MAKTKDESLRRYAVIKDRVRVSEVRLARYTEQQNKELNRNRNLRAALAVAAFEKFKASEIGKRLYPGVYFVVKDPNKLGPSGSLSNKFDGESALFLSEWQVDSLSTYAQRGYDNRNAVLYVALKARKVTWLPGYKALRTASTPTFFQIIIDKADKPTDLGIVTLNTAELVEKHLAADTRSKRRGR